MNALASNVLNLLCHFKNPPKFQKKSQQSQKHTTIGIRWWSPTQLLTDRSTAYVWQSGRDAQLFVVCGRMYQVCIKFNLYSETLDLNKLFGSDRCPSAIT